MISQVLSTRLTQPRLLQGERVDGELILLVLEGRDVDSDHVCEGEEDGFWCVNLQVMLAESE